MITKEFIAILVSIVVLLFLVRGLIKNEVYFRGVTIKKNESPIVYWIMLTLGFLAVITVFIVALIV
jgi:hypothetical protein